MKKISIIATFVLAFISVMFTGCISEEKESIQPSLNSESKNTTTEKNDKKLYEQGDFYKIFEIDHDNETSYEYCIYDKDNNILDSGTTINRPSEISSLGNNIIKNYQLLGMSEFQTRYYDIANKKISQWFPAAIAETTEKVAYLDYTVGTTKVLVQDIFNENATIDEYPIKPLAPDEIVTDAKFTSDKLKISIDNDVQKTIIIKLKK